MSKTTLAEDLEELGRAWREFTDEIWRALHVEPSAGRAALSRAWRQWTMIAVAMYAITVVTIVVMWLWSS